MSYIRLVAGYLLVALVTGPLVVHGWAQYRLNQILAEGSGITLREYVTPTWRHFAARVRSAEVTLSREEQAARFDRVAQFFDSQGRNEQERARREVTEARWLFHVSLGVFLLQIALAILLGITSAPKTAAQ